MKSGFSPLSPRSAVATGSRPRVGQWRPRPPERILWNSPYPGALATRRGLLMVTSKRGTDAVRHDLALSRFERILDNSARMAMVFIGCVVLLIVLKLGETILAPVSLALVIGLMFGPVADLFERRGIP